MKYKLKVIVLEKCPYSIAAVELLANYNIPFEKILVKQNNKEKFKTQAISTFPQVYMFNDKDQILLGGYSDLEEIINIINSSKNLDKIKEKFEEKYSNNKYTPKNIQRNVQRNIQRIILRIIEIFN
jgi:glutaredoxin